MEAGARRPSVAPITKTMPHHSKPSRDKERQGPGSYWKFAHRDWRFWVGLIAIFGAMFLYLATQDLSLRPRPPVPPPAPAGLGGR
jgi:hypothetical protein